MASDTVAWERRRFLSSVFDGGGMALPDFTVFIIDDDQGILDALIRFTNRGVDRHQFRACCLLIAARIWSQRASGIASPIRRLPSRDPAGMGTECELHEGNWIDRCAPRPGGVYRAWQRDIAVRPNYIAHPNLSSRLWVMSTSGTWRTFGCGDELVLSRGGQQFCTNRLCKADIFCFSA